ncbi:hypothetical protein AMATHDRAFT_71 [Amanita thiersii Skay4041]|uniref:Survival protein SurE-like phosphatase/nucleotidase domain-containing protein n=1 Tax=Amanita thiersii Skay4041 TaxID=703135 RepID=A0A2A9P0I0_9AGAR|nr:hypothetical protein AMATHDRAFT_71 [Amanita thiersii Skay4041]
MVLSVLLTNDDGPPSPHDSPYILGLYHHLISHLGNLFVISFFAIFPSLSTGCNVKVVLPSTQKSWIGKAFHIKEVTKGWYFYPKHDGQGEIAAKSRPLKDNEIAEWILLDGTPATCANVALHNLYPGQIDLVISGPNLGRNTSAALSLSSGTLGAALSASLSKTRSIALSYGTVRHPIPTSYFEPAHALSCRIIQHLWDHWGKDEGGLRNGEVDLYSINIPMIEGLLSEQGLTICWTSMWRNSYGRLFMNVSHTVIKQSMSAAGPDALDNDDGSLPNQLTKHDESGDLLFQFSPDISATISPALSSLPVGSDGWALQQGWVSVTPLRASFAEPETVIKKKIEDRIWKMKL